MGSVRGAVMSLCGGRGTVARGRPIVPLRGGVVALLGLGRAVMAWRRGAVGRRQPVLSTTLLVPLLALCLLLLLDPVPLVVASGVVGRGPAVHHHLPVEKPVAVAVLAGAEHGEVGLERLEQLVHHVGPRGVLVLVRGVEGV